MSTFNLVRPSELRDAAVKINQNGTHPLCAMFGRDETLSGGGYAIYMYFENRDEQAMEVLKACFDPDGSLEYPSATPAIPACVWYEREIKDMFGLIPIGHPDLRPLVLHETYPEDFHPLRKSVKKNAKVQGHRKYDMSTAKGEGIFEVAVGPIHAGIIEPGHFRFSQAGEAMLQLDAKLFFTHRGIEKAVEGMTPLEALHIVERICGACSVSHTWSYVQAIEKLAGVTVPRKAQLMRTFLQEMERLVNHIGDIGNIPAGVGFNPAISLGGRMKERLMRICEKIAGNRFLRGIIIPGGVKYDIDKEFLFYFGRDIIDIKNGVLDMQKMFREQENFQNRVNTTGIITKQVATDLAMVGVGARASGFHHDSRRDFTYGCYKELGFKSIRQKSGDVAARLMERIAEVWQSFEMVERLAKMIVNCEDDTLAVPCVVPARAKEAWGISESARGSNFHYLAVDKDGRIDRLFVRSASYPNWPALPIAVQKDIIPDFPLINKSFELCYACIDR